MDDTTAQPKPGKMGFEGVAAQQQVSLGDFLWDAHAAGMKILEFTTGRDFAEFNESELLQSVVSMMLGIIADRLEKLRRQFPAEFAQITEGARLIDMGTHAETLDTAKVWRVVEEIVPEAVAEVRVVLDAWHEN